MVCTMSMYKHTLKTPTQPLPAYLDGHASAVEALAKQHTLATQAVVGSSKLKLCVGCWVCERQTERQTGTQVWELVRPCTSAGVTRSWCSLCLAPALAHSLLVCQSNAAAIPAHSYTACASNLTTPPHTFDREKACPRCSIPFM